MVAMSSLPSKLFFRIGEVAGLVGVEPHVLRYWEREFRSIRPTKSAKGQRVYSRKDVENLLRVRDLLYRDGFTIAGAKKRLQRGGVEPEALVAADAALEADLLRDHDADAREGEDGVEDEAADEAAVPESGQRALADAEAEVDPLRAAPSSPDTPAPAPPTGLAARTKLSALRAEVEAFLEELESPAPPARPDRAKQGERA